MSATRRTEAFLALADRGLRSAEILFRAGQMEDATLFVQQVVERVARGLLAHSGIMFGTSHNLGQMAAALGDEHPLREQIREFDDLSAAVTAFRYPTSSGRLARAPAAPDLEKRIGRARELIAAARAYMRRFPRHPGASLTCS